MESSANQYRVRVSGWERRDGERKRENLGCLRWTLRCLSRHSLSCYGSRSGRWELQGGVLFQLPANFRTHGELAFIYLFPDFSHCRAAADFSLSLCRFFSPSEFAFPLPFFAIPYHFSSSLAFFAFLSFCIFVEQSIFPPGMFLITSSAVEGPPSEGEWS